MNDLIVLPQTNQWQRLKALVLDSVSSPITKRVYNLGLDEFIPWPVRHRTAPSIGLWSFRRSSSIETALMVTGCAAWIAELEARRAAEPDLLDYAEALVQVVARAREVLGRLEDGIALLAANADAREAFRFASRAMWQQRVRSVWIEARKAEPGRQLAEVDIPKNRSWRAFQLAFILINLPGITSLDRPDRGASPYAGADLLWFPTGGGKTEAPGTACLRLERSGVIMYPAWPGWIRRDHAGTDTDSRRAVEPERLSVTG